MKLLMYYSVIIGGVLLATINQISLVQQIPREEKTSQGTIITKPFNNQGISCPAVLPSIGEIIFSNIDLPSNDQIYLHCPKCNLGVFRSTENREAECTYCGSLEI